MAYTQDDIRASLRKLLPETVRHPVDPVSGVRNGAVTFEDMQAGAAYLFLEEPRAVPYVRSLGARKLREQATAQLEQLQSLIDDVRSLRRPPLRKSLPTSSLSDAATGLTQMETALATGDFHGMDELPAYERVRRGLDTFLAATRSSVSHAGQIARSKTELRTWIPAQVAGIRTTHTQLVQLTEYLSEDDYDVQDVFRLVALRAAQAARKLVTQIAIDAAHATQKETEEGLRQTALDLLAVEAVLSQLSALSAAAETVEYAGVASPFADADHPATPASLESLPGPFDIRSSSPVLDVSVDGGAAQSFAMPSALDSIRINGTRSEPFVFRSAAEVAELATGPITPFVLAAGETIYLTLSHVSGGVSAHYYVPAPFAAGAYNTPADVASVLDAAIVGEGADADFEVTSDTSRVFVRALVAGSADRVEVRLSYPMTGHLGWTPGQSSVGQDINNVLSLKTKAFTEHFTFAAGSWGLADVVDRVNSTHSPLLLLEAEAYEVLYATPAYRVFSLVSTDPSVDADVQVLGEYNDGVSNLPALAGQTLGLVQAVTRQASMVTAESVRAAVDTVTGVSFEIDGTKFRLTSLDETVLSQLVISGSACSALMGSAVLSGRGTTPWLSLSEPCPIAVGDMLTVYPSTTAYSVLSVSPTVLRVTPELPSDHAAIRFDAQTGTYGVITSTAHAQDGVFQAELSAWLSVWQDPGSYFYSLNRLLNTVLVDALPPAAEVNDAVSHLETLEAALTQLIASADVPQVERVERVDLLLRTWRAFGADRLIDLLLSGRFAEFFSVKSTQVSYKSALAEAIREIAQNELAISGVDRGQDIPRDVVSIAGTLDESPIPLGPEDMYP